MHSHREKSNCLLAIDPKKVISFPISESGPGVEYNIIATVCYSIVYKDFPHKTSHLLLAATL